MKPGARMPLIIGVGGTSRRGSSTERALRVSLSHAERQGADTEIFSGEDLLLPMYNPGDLKRTPQASRLIDLFRQADGIIVASPAYHGSISGILKNAIDYTEDLRGDSRVYWDGCAVGCICCAGGWQAAAQTLSTMRAIVHALRGWPTPMGAVLNTSLPIFDAKGDIVDEAVDQQLQLVATQVVQFAKIGSRLVSNA